MSHQIPARVRALDAVIREAESRVGERSYWQRFTSSDVRDRLEGECSDRTLRRALNDAAELEWVVKSRQEWKPGERAKKLAAGGGVTNTLE